MDTHDWATASALIKQEHYSHFARAVAKWRPEDVAEVFRHIPLRKSKEAFLALAEQQRVEIFVHLDVKVQHKLLHSLSKKQDTSILAHLSPDDRAHIIGSMPVWQRGKYLKLLNSEDLQETRELLKYPDESVGRFMTPDFVAIKQSWTIRKAIAHIREVGLDSESLSVIYVTNTQGKLVDDIRLRHLIISDPKKLVKDVMDGTYISLHVYDDREEAVRLMKKYDVFSLPVINEENTLLGIVTADDVLDIQEAEATEDFHKGASITPLKTSYRQTSILSLYQRRIWWLALLVGINLISSGVIEHFEEVLASAIALAFFIPLLIDSGGNTGSQSATLMIRALATQDVKMHEWFRVFIKELGIGALLGVTLGLLTWGLGWFRADGTIGIIVGLTMISIVIVANLLGAILPFILSKIKIDPAVASAPLITSIADAVGLIIYFSIAVAILGTI